MIGNYVNIVDKFFIKKKQQKKNSWIKMFVVQWGADTIILYNISFDICGENKT